MLRLCCILWVVLLLGSVGSAQPTGGGPSSGKFDAEIALAKLAFQAHGGEKLRAMKNLVVRGTGDVTTSAFNQALPITFVVVLAREKYRFEIVHPVQQFKQASDGVNTSTSIHGFTLPPINRLGLPLLQMVGEKGFEITALPPERKKKRGFRMTSPDGYYTDFYLDEKTNQIKGYDSSYDVYGRRYTTSVEVDKVRVVAGIVVPERYAQRIETEQMIIYASFKAKEILVDSEIDNGIFVLS